MARCMRCARWKTDSIATTTTLGCSLTRSYSQTTLNGTRVPLPHHSLNEFSRMLTPVLPPPSTHHKSHVNPCLRACVFRPGPWRALVSAFVDQRDKGEGGERQDAGGEYHIRWQFTVRLSLIDPCLNTLDNGACVQVSQYVPIQCWGPFYLPLDHTLAPSYWRIFQFFYRHPILQGFRYYWRVECVFFRIHHKKLPFLNRLYRPGVRFHCDINIDPFVFMHENNKTYGSFLRWH